MSSSTGIPQEPVTALAHRKDMANPPVVAVSALSSSSRCSASHSSAPTLNSQTLAWDQTFLRITYLVSTMTGPATPSQQPSPTTSNPENQHTLPDRRGNGLEGFQDWPDHPALADPAEPKHEKTGWAILSKDKVMRKITQVSKWRDEVVAHADFAYCACSSMPLPTNYGAPVQNRYAPYFDEQSAAPSISPDGICSHCSHPAAPIEPVKQEWQDSTHQKLKSAMNNFKNRLIGRVPTKRKGPSSSQGTVKDLQTTSGIPIGLKQPKEQDSSAHISRSCPAFPRTGMYHISAPPRGPGLKDDLDISSNDAEDDVRSGASSSDSNNHGLFATNARLKRAQHLLARQKPPSPRQQCDDI